MSVCVLLMAFAITIDKDVRFWYSRGHFFFVQPTFFNLFLFLSLDFLYIFFNLLKIMRV